MKVYEMNEIPEGYQQKSRAIYVLLGLFLGGFGVHEFYRGCREQGCAYLAGNLICQIWFWAGLIGEGAVYYFPAIVLIFLPISVIVGLVKNDRDGNGVLMK